jgi:hypothetical protein
MRELSDLNFKCTRSYWVQVIGDQNWAFAVIRQCINKFSVYRFMWAFNYPLANEVAKGIPCDLDLWPRKSIGFQTLLRTKYVPSLVNIHWRMLILECSQGCYGRTDGSVTISLCNFVGEGIIKGSHEPVNRKFIDTLPYHSKCSVLISNDLNPITPGD